MDALTGAQEHVNENARDILMEMEGINFSYFVETYRKHFDKTEPLHMLKFAFTRYRGWDGREPATHDIVTGNRLGE